MKGAKQYTVVCTLSMSATPAAHQQYKVLFWHILRLCLS